MELVLKSSQKPVHILIGQGPDAVLSQDRLSAGFVIDSEDDIGRSRHGGSESIYILDIDAGVPDDLEDLLWLFGDEYYISTESYEGVTKNYIRCLENMLEEFEPSDDPFQYKLIRETLEQAEALRIRLLAVTAYNMQMEAAVQNHDNDPDDFDPDELPF